MNVSQSRNEELFIYPFVCHTVTVIYFMLSYEPKDLYLCLISNTTSRYTMMDKTMWVNSIIYGFSVSNMLKYAKASKLLIPTLLQAAIWSFCNAFPRTTYLTIHFSQYREALWEVEKYCRNRIVLVKEYALSNSATNTYPPDFEVCHASRKKRYLSSYHGL